MTDHLGLFPCVKVAQPGWPWPARPPAALPVPGGPPAPGGVRPPAGLPARDDLAAAGGAGLAGTAGLAADRYAGRGLRGAAAGLARGYARVAPAARPEDLDRLMAAARARTGLGPDRLGYDFAHPPDRRTAAKLLFRTGTAAGGRRGLYDATAVLARGTDLGMAAHELGHAVDFARTPPPAAAPAARFLGLPVGQWARSGSRGLVRLGARAAPVAALAASDEPAAPVAAGLAGSAALVRQNRTLLGQEFRAAREGGRLIGAARVPLRRALPGRLGAAAGLGTYVAPTLVPAAAGGLLGAGSWLKRQVVGPTGTKTGAAFPGGLARWVRPLAGQLAAAPAAAARVGQVAARGAGTGVGVAAGAARAAVGTGVGAARGTAGAVRPALGAAGRYVGELAGYGPGGPLAGQRLFDATTVPARTPGWAARHLYGVEPVARAADRVARNRFVHPVLQAGQTAERLLTTPVTSPLVARAAGWLNRAGRANVGAGRAALGYGQRAGAGALSAADRASRVGNRWLGRGLLAGAAPAAYQRLRDRPGELAREVVRSVPGQDAAAVEANPEVQAIDADPWGVAYDVSPLGGDRTPVADAVRATVARAGRAIVPNLAADALTQRATHPLHRTLDRLQSLTLGGQALRAGLRAAADDRPPDVPGILREELAARVPQIAADPVGAWAGPVGQRAQRLLAPAAASPQTTSDAVGRLLNRLPFVEAFPFTQTDPDRGIGPNNPERRVVVFTPAGRADVVTPSPRQAVTDPAGAARAVSARSTVAPRRSAAVPAGGPR